MDQTAADAYTYVSRQQVDRSLAATGRRSREGQRQARKGTEKEGETEEDKERERDGQMVAENIDQRADLKSECE